MTGKAPSAELMDSDRPKVFRVRNLPGELDRHATVKLLAVSLKGIHYDDIHISSLARAINSWGKSPTSVATVLFKRLPAILSAENGRNEWELKVEGLTNTSPVILDTHFYGMTPLNDVDPVQHTHDCVVISGLASHPFGSWQPRGDDKSFMWIRDALPSALPSVRFVLYGYDSTLKDSTSFQTILDLAINFVSSLQAGGWTSPSTKPVLFLAHSLGGVILKQALVILAGGDERATWMLSNVPGAVFFGVPSVGMPVTHLLSMVQGQPNEALVTELSGGSDFVPKLEEQFTGISYIRWMKLFFAYETKTSATVTKLANGNYVRSGPRAISVSRESATSNKCFLSPTDTIQIDEDHSTMVKYGPGDHRIPIMISRIGDICKFRPLGSEHPESWQQGGARAKREVFRDTKQAVASASSARYTAKKSTLWDYKLILSSQRAPERDRRLEEIEENLPSTFEWVFDRSIGLTNWLHDGNGIFWISGKPGSGKSTLMKFILRDKRIGDFLRPWKPTARQISASFFFHHRGTTIQKSLEGLLRSIITQLLETEPRLNSCLDSVLDETYQSRLRAEELDTDLHSELVDVCKALGGRYDDILQEDIDCIVEGRDVRIKFKDKFGNFFDQLAHGIGEDNAYKIRKRLLDGGISVIEAPRRKANEFVHELCLGKSMPQRYASEFQRLALQWLEESKLENRINVVLKKCNIEDRLEAKNLAANQHRRNSIKKSLEEGEWPKVLLDGILLSLFNQTALDLDLCLFFDALDEYDGPPEVISNFLKALTERSPTSRLRVRVLFSSRPWNQFRDTFGSCPGFPIDQHTVEDIWTYCTGTISRGPPCMEALYPLVEDVVLRAKGVFLWVKLVIKDLFNAVHDASPDVAQVELQRTLDALPSDLDDYYKIIIERIPQPKRWDAFVVMETVLRSRTRLTVRKLLIILAHSKAKRYADIERLGLHSEDKLDAAPIIEASGGLIDILNPEASLPGDSGVEFMHQTCKDLVLSPHFKHLVLEHRANVVSENGHSFIAKACLGNYLLPYFSEDAMLFHARMAENSTGTSQFQLFKTAPQRCFEPEFENYFAMAVGGTLRLCIKDALSLDSTIIARTANLTLVLFDALDSSVEVTSDARDKDVTLTVARLLVSHGLDISRNKAPIRFPVRPSDVDLLIILLSTLDNLDFLVQPCDKQGGVWTAKGAAMPLLHFGSVDLANWLLDKGAHPNALGGDGMTALDRAFHFYCYIREPAGCYDVEFCNILLQKGGKLKLLWGGDVRRVMEKMPVYGRDPKSFAYISYMRDEGNDEVGSHAEEERHAENEREMPVLSQSLKYGRRS